MPVVSLNIPKGVCCLLTHLRRLIRQADKNHKTMAKNAGKARMYTSFHQCVYALGFHLTEEPFSTKDKIDS